MSLHLYNTLSREKEPFTPIDPAQVKLYTCGPTVYNYAHIGNLRSFLSYDLLRRVLELRGYNVRHVMNITDVDDKTIRDSQAEGRALREFTDFYLQAFLEDLSNMRIIPAHDCPRATDAVEPMLALVAQLIDSGHAYQADDGSVYFSVGNFPGYGRLARLDMAKLKPGKRVVADEYTKEDVHDFALWKAWSEKDGPVSWPSPYGKGRPGWHLECSVLALQNLGEQIDIHMGGVDLIFPHHENEIAQSEAATGKTFARYWLHNEHLQIEGKKMSKSLGNFWTLRDLEKKGISPRALRYNFLSTHYRQKQNLTMAGLEGASSALATLDGFIRGLTHAGPGDARAEILAQIAAGRHAIGQALDDDINTPKALGVLFQLVRSLKQAQLRASEVGAVRALLDEADAVFGILEDTPMREPEPEVVALASKRQQARQSKDWAEADALRDAIATRGWRVEDGKDGFQLVPLDAT